MKRALMGVLCASALIGVGVGSCDDNNTVGTDTVAYDSYLYYGYYPADVYYSGYYWTDPYYYYYAATYGGGRPPTTTGSAGSTGTSTTGAAGATGTSMGGSGGSSSTRASGEMTMGDVLRAMARGETVCPNQVTITPRRTQTHVFTLPATSAPQHFPCIVHADWVLTLLAERLRLTDFLSNPRARARAQCVLLGDERRW